MVSLRNSLRRHRVAAGLSQQELAQRAGISRQAYAALESGKAAPSTVVSIRLATGWRTHVGARFSRADGPPGAVQADWVAPGEVISGTGSQEALLASKRPQTVRLMPVGGRLLARPLSSSMGARFGLVEADGVIVPGLQEDPAKVQVRPFDVGEVRMPCLALLGCDPAMVLLETGLSQKGVRLVWQEESSYQARACLSRCEAHCDACQLRTSATGR